MQPIKHKGAFEMELTGSRFTQWKIKTHKGTFKSRKQTANYTIFFPCLFFIAQTGHHVPLFTYAGLACQTCPFSHFHFKREKAFTYSFESKAPFLDLAISCITPISAFNFSATSV